MFLYYTGGWSDLKIVEKISMYSFQIILITFASMLILGVINIYYLDMGLRNILWIGIFGISITANYTINKKNAYSDEQKILERKYSEIDQLIQKARFENLDTERLEYKLSVIKHNIQRGDIANDTIYLDRLEGELSSLYENNIIGNLAEIELYKTEHEHEMDVSIKTNPMDVLQNTFSEKDYDKSLDVVNEYGNVIEKVVNSINARCEYTEKSIYSDKGEESYNNALKSLISNDFQNVQAQLIVFESEYEQTFEQIKELELMGDVAELIKIAEMEGIDVKDIKTNYESGRNSILQKDIEKAEEMAVNCESQIKNILINHFSAKSNAFEKEYQQISNFGIENGGLLANIAKAKDELDQQQIIAAFDIINNTNAIVESQITKKLQLGDKRIVRIKDVVPNIEIIEKLLDISKLRLSESKYLNSIKIYDKFSKDCSAIEKETYNSFKNKIDQYAKELSELKLKGVISTSLEKIIIGCEEQLKKREYNDLRRDLDVYARESKKCHEMDLKLNDTISTLNDKLLEIKGRGVNIDDFISKIVKIKEQESYDDAFAYLSIIENEVQDRIHAKENDAELLLNQLSEYYEADPLLHKHIELKELYNNILQSRNDANWGNVLSYGNTWVDQYEFMNHEKSQYHNEIQNLLDKIEVAKLSGVDVNKYASDLAILESVS
jgi:hypothetical protein